MIEALSRDPRGLQLPIVSTVWRNGTAIRHIRGKVSPRKTVEVTTKVCHACNTGWMNRVGTRARRYIESMMRDDETELPPEAQAGIAAFMTMTGITTFATHHRAFVKREWTDAIRTTETALPEWYVWVGRYLGRQPLLAFMHDISFVDMRGMTVVDHGVVATLVVGYVALQVLHCRGLRIDDHPGVPLLRVGPPGGAVLRWPPSEHLTDETIEPFADRFIGNVPARAEPD